MRRTARGWYEGAVRPRLVAAVDGFSWAEEHAFLRKWFDPVAGPLVDFACGGGDHGRLLSRWHTATRVVACDLDPAALERAAGHPDAPGCHVQADVGHLPFASASLGGAICCGGLAHFSKPDAALAEMARTLRPGAPWIAICPRDVGSTRQKIACHIMGVTTYDDAGWTPWLARHGLHRLDVQSRGWTTLIAARKT